MESESRTNVGMARKDTGVRVRGVAEEGEGEALIPLVITLGEEHGRELQQQERDPWVCVCGTVSVGKE